MYFYLNEKSFFVSGAYKGAIYKLDKKELYYLEHQEAEWLAKSEAGHEIEQQHMEFFNELEQEGLGFFRDRPSFVEKARLYNPYLIKRKDLNPIHISRAYIKLNDECQGHCSVCNQYFCPICYAEGNKEVLDTHQ